MLRNQRARLLRCRLGTNNMQIYCGDESQLIINITAIPVQIKIENDPENTVYFAVSQGAFGSSRAFFAPTIPYHGQ